MMAREKDGGTVDKTPPVPPDQPVEPVKEPPEKRDNPGTPNAPVREPGPQPPERL